ncbi:MAG: sodium:alanine symporter family protein [Bacteroidales bacterium]|nr:sodium:alanine symporter family protein [Bacteroidales bacterium]
MEEFSEIIDTISGIVWGWPMIILLIGTHLFLTIILKVPQRKIFTAIRMSFHADKGSVGDVSHFGALATSLAATIGTGNIIGVATAISLGGPGAVFWCFLTGILGIATKYSEGLLAVKYRVKTRNGEILGGPMYALERGLGMKWLAVLFCIFTCFAAFGIGNAVQAKAISDNLSQFFPTADPSHVKAVIGITTSALVSIVIFGGVKKITRICANLVPLMAALYIIGCIYILFVNYEHLLPAIKWIVSDAFSVEAGLGGAAGVAIMTTMRYGIARGLFSNEAGLGSAPIIGAAAQSKNPVRQALVLSSGVFWDSVVICTMTGLVIVSSILAFDHIEIGSSGILTEHAFGQIPYVGTPILSAGIVTFAFSTILGWCYCGEKAIEYLGGKKLIKPYRMMWVIVTIIGSCMGLTLVWNISDIMNALMAVPNLIALLLLYKVLCSETRHYLWNNNLDEVKDETIEI